MSRWKHALPWAAFALATLPLSGLAGLACATSPTTQLVIEASDDGGEGGATGPGSGGDGSASTKDGESGGEGGGSTGPDGGTSSGGGDGGAGSEAGAGGDSGGAGTGGDSGSTGAPDAGPDAPATTAPFDVSWCPGSAITQNQVLGIFAPAATTATLATVTLDARQRNCQDQTGCQAWTPSTTLPLYAIQWNGNGFNFNGPTNITVPATGTATCTVPGPSCTATVGPFSALVYSSTPQQVTSWGVSPSVNGQQAQVGSWSPDPSGDYLEWGSVTTTASCLFGTENGRVYGAGGTYVEYQLVLYATY
jgi:hypothetical protein